LRELLGEAFVGSINPDHLVDRIHEAAVFPEVWPDVLEDIARTVDAAGMVFITSDTAHWTGIWNGVIPSPSIQEAMSAYIRDGVASRTQATPRLLALDCAGFATDEDFFTAEEWDQDPHRAEWNRKWGYKHAAATIVRSPSEEFLVFHLERRADRPPFSRQELDKLDRFRPHLARAGLLATRWRLERMRAAAEALALVGLPALVIERTGRVVAANALIEAMTDFLRWLPKDRMALQDGRADAMLRAGLAELGTTRDGAVTSFAACSAADHSRAVVHLIPTPGKARDLFDGALGVLVVTPVMTAQAPNLALIRGLFDLTPGEARIAQGIAQGLTIDGIAADRGVSRETIRTQIKSVLAKTGTRSQKDVVSLLGAIPKVPLSD
jgi:DNA-binding CsgD family transcriptional regulator